MLSYEFLKVFHIIAAIGFISFGVLSLSTPSASKLNSALFGIFSLLVIAGGFGLIGSLGMEMWMMHKFSVWIAIMAMVGVVRKRFPKFRVHATVGLFLLTAVAVSLAVYKPL